MIYITTQGDTWDYIAYKNYGLIGREYLMSELLNANPEYINLVVLPANLKLNIPEAIIPDTLNLPPWLL